MAALFYTNHKMGNVQEMFQKWLGLYRTRAGQKKAPRATIVPAIDIQIDTDLANAQYDNQNEIENMKIEIGDHLEQNSRSPEETQQNMIHIEGEDEFDDNMDSSKQQS